jgi:hypothetical protein
LQGVETEPFDQGRGECRDTGVAYDSLVSNGVRLAGVAE